MVRDKSHCWACLQFALGYRYLRDQLKFKFPEVRAHAAAAAAQERERQVSQHLRFGPQALPVLAASQSN